MKQEKIVIIGIWIVVVLSTWLGELKISSHLYPMKEAISFSGGKKSFILGVGKIGKNLSYEI